MVGFCVENEEAWLPCAVGVPEGCQDDGVVTVVI